MISFELVYKTKGYQKHRVAIIAIIVRSEVAIIVIIVRSLTYLGVQYAAVPIGPG